MDKTTDKQKTSTGHKINKTDCKDVKKISYKNFFPTLFVLLKSPTFVFLCLAYSCSFMGITSFAIFMAKTIQFQYNQIPSMAAILAGKIYTHLTKLINNVYLILFKHKYCYLQFVYWINSRLETAVTLS